MCSTLSFGQCPTYFRKHCKCDPFRGQNQQRHSTLTVIQVPPTPKPRLVLRVSCQPSTKEGGIYKKKNGKKQKGVRPKMPLVKETWSCICYGEKSVVTQKSQAKKQQKLLGAFMYAAREWYDRVNEGKPQTGHQLNQGHLLSTKTTLLF